MGVHKIKPGILYVGVIDWDRRLFDELIPTPNGTSYNSYLIIGSEKTALIDTADPTKKGEFLENLEKAGIKRLDYIIPNHGEQDHSGLLPEVTARYPEAKIVTNKKCKDILIDHLHLDEGKFIVINDRDTLSLGDKTLEFIFAPWVHWPETMLTYLREDKILFPCDFLGSHYAPKTLIVEEDPEIYLSAKRYFAEIMMPFRQNIKNNLAKIEDLEIKLIAPSHGPMYSKPEFIINAYKEWISDDVKNEAVIIYTSMHGSVKRMVMHLADSLIERGIGVKVFNLPRTDIGELAMSLIDAATLIIGTSAVLTGPHPTVVEAAYLANILRVKTKFATVIGSYGWGSRMLDKIKEEIPNLKAELIEPVIVKGHPREKDLQELDKLADKILEKHKALNII
ncbi:MAG: FprA family A-type flavoprotein [Candidatus Odinarchaeia archaeon]